MNLPEKLARAVPVIRSIACHDDATYEERAAVFDALRVLAEQEMAKAKARHTAKISGGIAKVLDAAKAAGGPQEPAEAQA